MNNAEKTARSLIEGPRLDLYPDEQGEIARALLVACEALERIARLDSHGWKEQRAREALAKIRGEKP